MSWVGASAALILSVLIAREGFAVMGAALKDDFTGAACNCVHEKGKGHSHGKDKSGASSKGVCGAWLRVVCARLLDPGGALYDAAKSRLRTSGGALRLKSHLTEMSGEQNSFTESGQPLKQGSKPAILLAAPAIFREAATRIIEESSQAGFNEAQLYRAPDGFCGTPNEVGYFSEWISTAIGTRFFCLYLKRAFFIELCFVLGAIVAAKVALHTVWLAGGDLPPGRLDMDRLQDTFEAAARKAAAREAAAKGAADGPGADLASQRGPTSQSAAECAGPAAAAA